MVSKTKRRESQKILNLKTIMKPEQIEIAKQKMKEYTDFFGGSFNNKQKIDSAKSISDLEEIFQEHDDFLSDMANDAQHSLGRFKRSIGVFEDYAK